jgi:transcriptional regulator with XRE-family HTH domain
MTYHASTAVEATMRFGAMLQAYRKKAGMTQAQLAERTGIPLRSIQNWEIGHRMPRPHALLSLARAVGITVEQLLTETPPAAAEPSAEAPPPEPPKPARGRKPRKD